MKQLSGLDAAFLHMETASQFGHVAGLSIFRRSEKPGVEPYQAWRARIAERLPLLEPLTRRLVDVPFGLDHPFWIDDPRFDLDFHVRHTAVPPPGGDSQLAELVARIIGRPLDRSRPLWLSYVIDGLSGDRFATLTILHHATIDGASGIDLLSMMLDAEPDAPSPTVVAGRARPARLPSDIEMLGRAVSTLARKPGRALLLGARTVREVGVATRNPVLIATADRVRRGLRGPVGAALNIGRRRPEERDALPQLPSLRVPRTPFNASISPHRRFAFASTSLDTVKQIKNHLGATVNDVVMAVCAGGLRRWLESVDALPDEPLVAIVPVSIRTGHEADRWTNRVTALTSSLPTHLADPVERVAFVHEAMAQSKELFGALPAERLTDFAEFPPPAVFARAMRLSARLGLGRRLIPGNLIISNVPGPRATLYAAGAELLHYYPVSTVVEGQGLNITVQSYRDVLDFGLVSCRELVPDLESLLAMILDELEALAAQCQPRRRGRPTSTAR